MGNVWQQSRVDGTKLRKSGEKVSDVLFPLYFLC